MSSPTERHVTSRVIRSGEPVPPDADWLALSMAERIEAVWTLKETCLAWNTEAGRVPRLQRSVSRVQRGRG